MKYIDLGCNIKCWECSRDCSIKEIMQYSIHLLNVPEYNIEVEFQQKKFYSNSENAEKFFYYYVIETLKAIGGMIISTGIDPKVVQQEVTETSVALYVARQKMIETLKNEE